VATFDQPRLVSSQVSGNDYSSDTLIVFIGDAGDRGRIANSGCAIKTQLRNTQI
jgi:hypothetical protein